MSAPAAARATPTSTPPPTMRAVVTRLFRSPVVRTVPTPTRGPNEVLVKVSAAALNPTDWKSTMLTRGGYIMGCDWAGTVVSAPEGTGFVKGDKVAGPVHGSNSARTGAFAEYLVADPAVVWRRPDNITAAEAATLNVSWCTSALALEKTLGRFAATHSISQDTSPLIIYSANSCTGQYAIQFYRHYHPHAPIIALASTASHPHLKSLGATLCLPYSLTAPELRAALTQHNIGPVHLAFDCHSAGDSQHKLADVLDSPGHVVGVMRPGKPKKAGIEASWVLTYTITGEAFKFLLWTIPAAPEDHALASKRLKELTGLLAPGGGVVPVRTRSVGGLEGVAGGLAELKAGKVRGEKLVVEIAKD